MNAFPRPFRAGRSMTVLEGARSNKILVFRLRLD
jgi:hypothetical protein